MAAFLFLFSLVKAVIRMSCLCDLANIVVLFWSLVQLIEKYIFVLLCFYFLFCFGVWCNELRNISLVYLCVGVFFILYFFMAVFFLLVLF